MANMVYYLASLFCQGSDQGIKFHEGYYYYTKVSPWM